MLLWGLIVTKFTDRQKSLHTARVYLMQSRATKHRGWSFWRLDAAGRARRECLPVQRGLL